MAVYFFLVSYPIFPNLYVDSMISEFEEKKKIFIPWINQIFVGNKKKFMIALCTFNPYSKDENLKDLIYNYFKEHTFPTTCELTSLPPTEEVANQHSLRVHLRVQQWIITIIIKACSCK